MSSFIAVLGVGLALGVRHATDPDHVVAVMTIASRERSSRGALAVGALWGLGHAATVVTAGAAIILFDLVIPPRVALFMEMCVALLLVGLGVMNLVGMPGARKSEHAHAPHEHVGALHRLKDGSAVRPVFVGLLHGL